MMGTYKKLFSVYLFSILAVLPIGRNHKDLSFKDFVNKFTDDYTKLDIPGIQYDYTAYFKEIPDLNHLKKQQDFFTKSLKSVQLYNKVKLNSDDKVLFDQLLYEIDFNLQRITLEKAWVNDGRLIPSGGLHDLKNYKEWCSYFIKKYTSLNLGPEQIMTLGKSEVKRVKDEIRKIQEASGKDSIGFYNYLRSESFLIHDQQQLVKEFEKTDSIIRINLNGFIDNITLPKVYAVEWSEAGANTPPGMYLNHSDNAYGKDVFQYNFYGNKFNKRAVDWLFMHEAIPGHHLQFSIREGANENEFQRLFSYSGNFEGWACYVEYEGKQLGLYRDIYTYLGKWEWDLVRSARLVIDTGIHFYGWTRKDAMDYWKQNITGQDEIADREITRVTNWPGQALSYKVGADCIMKIKNELKNKYGSKFNQSKFHKTYLAFGMCPLEVVKKDFNDRYIGQIN